MALDEPTNTLYNSYYTRRNLCARTLTSFVALSTCRHTHTRTQHTQPEEPLRTVLYCAPTKMLPGMPRGIYLLRYWYIIMYYYESFPFSIVLLAWKYFDRPNGLEEGGFLCGKITPTPRLLSWLQIKRCGRWLRHGKRTYWRCVWENQLKDYRIHIL